MIAVSDVIYDARIDNGALNVYMLTRPDIQDDEKDVFFLRHQIFGQNSTPDEQVVMSRYCASKFSESTREIVCWAKRFADGLSVTETTTKIAESINEFIKENNLPNSLMLSKVACGENGEELWMDI
jgi:hypothetical protein